MDDNSQDVTSSNTLHDAIDLLKAAARISDPGYGEWAYDTWVALNERYFDGRLIPGGISWGLTPHGKTLGYYSHWRNHITLHVSLLDPRGDAWGLGRLLGTRFAADVLLHEMIHQANYQDHGTTRVKGEPHNHDLWCAEVVRLSPLVLGVEVKAQPVKQRRVDGKVRWTPEDGHLTRAQIATWPYLFRPASYYETTAASLLQSLKRNVK